ncbi:MAG TPA: hypothetical protein VFB50_04910, partial [Chloroflexota bacterium]|nr:hypothetical protein [Chloroflexota bacterium]
MTQPQAPADPNAPAFGPGTTGWQAFLQWLQANFGGGDQVNEPDASQPIGGAGTQTPQQPAQPTGQPSAQAQATLNYLVNQHGAVVGQPAPVTFKNAITGKPEPDPSGAQTYTFADGATAVIG